jgi:hypothetical protein
MIKKRGWSSKIRYYHQSSYRRVPDFANLFHRFKRTMSVLGRSEVLVETTVSMLPLWRFIWKSPNWARCRTSARILISTSKRSKTPSQTYFKHCVYGLRFLLKSEGFPYEYLHLPSIKHDKKLSTLSKKKFGDYFNIVNSLNTKYSLVCCTVVVCCMEVQVYACKILILTVNNSK